jgi:heme exporter protein D
MNVSDLSGFLHMGGYALYVWGSFGCGLLVYGWNLLAPGCQRRALLRRLAEDAA